MAPPCNYVSMTRRPGPARLMWTFADSPLFKSGMIPPRRYNSPPAPVTASKLFPHPPALSVPFGDWGRAGQGVGEPGPASGWPPLQAPPPRGPR